MPTLEERVAAIEGWLKRAEERAVVDRTAALEAWTKEAESHQLVSRVEELEKVHAKFGWVFELFAPKA